MKTIGLSWQSAQVQNKDKRKVKATSY